MVMMVMMMMMMMIFFVRSLREVLSHSSSNYVVFSSLFPISI